MIGLRESVFEFEGSACCHELTLVIIRFSASKTDGVHLVDGNVKMEVGFVGMDGRDTLMPLEPDRGAELILYIFDLGCRGLLAGLEGHHEMIGLVAPAALIAALGD